MLGEAQPELEDRFLYWEFFEGGFKQAARMGKWKVIRDGLNAKLRLYDLEKDLGEKADVASRFPDVAKKFEAMLDSARTPSPAWPVEGE